MHIDEAKNEKELYELEKYHAEKIDFKLFFKNDEYVITDFKGVVTLPSAHLEYDGHIYLTNYQLIFPYIPRAKVIGDYGIDTPVIPVGSIIIGAGVKAHIKSARKKLIRVLKQNPDMFYIKNPYNINLFDGSPNITFEMDYNYSNINQKMKKYKLSVYITIRKFRKERSSDFKLRRKEIISKVAEFFSKFPNN